MLAKVASDQTASSDVTSKVQEELLKKLHSMRYDQPKNTHAGRPKKKDKLPAGVAYTCSGGDGEIRDSVNTEMEKEKAVETSSKRQSFLNYDSDSSDISDTQVGRPARKKTFLDDADMTSDSEEEDDPMEVDVEEQEQVVEQEQAVEKLDVDSYVVCVYQEEWYIGQVVDKTNDEYYDIKYMERVAAGTFKWPNKDDKLMTCKEDILFKCEPIVSFASSTIRAVKFTLPKNDLKKFDKLMTQLKDYFHTKPNLAFFQTTIISFYFKFSL